MAILLNDNLMILASDSGSAADDHHNQLLKDKKASLYALKDKITGRTRL